MRLFDDDVYWVQTFDGDPAAIAIFEEHYSCRELRNRKLIVGPGQKLVLIGKNKDALFVWRKYISDDGQTGINCAVFRNDMPKERRILSSILLDQAEKIAWRKWPNETRLFTYVNAKAVKSANPGYCYKMNGWNVCGVTQERKYVILEKFKVQ